MSDDRPVGIWILDEFGLHDARGLGGEGYRAWLDRKARERELPVVDTNRVVEGEGFHLGYDASDEDDRDRIRAVVREYEGFEEWEPEHA